MQVLLGKNNNNNNKLEWVPGDQKHIQQCVFNNDIQ